MWAMLRGNPGQIWGAESFLAGSENPGPWSDFEQHAPIRTNNENFGIDLQVLSISTANVYSDSSIWNIA